MTDTYEHLKPYALVATYQSVLTAVLAKPYDIHVFYDATSNVGFVDSTLDTNFSTEIESVSIQTVVAIDSAISADFYAESVARFDQTTAAHNVVLDFASIWIDSNVLNFGSGIDLIDTALNTSLNPEVIVFYEAVYVENASVDTSVNTSINTAINSIFDINFVRGIFVLLNCDHQVGTQLSVSLKAPWFKPVNRTYKSAFIFESGINARKNTSVQFERGHTLSRSIKLIHDEGVNVNRSNAADWDDGLTFKKQFDAHFEQSTTLGIQRLTVWQEMIRKRKNVDYSHDVAHVFEKRFTAPWDKGLEIVTSTALAFDKARAISYKKHPVVPWVPAKPAQYKGNTNLDFTCKLESVDSHNLVLNFGGEKCLPQFRAIKWWHIVNDINVTRLDNGTKLNVLNGSYSCDRSQFCWSYQLTIPVSELSKAEPIAGQPVVLKIIVNGDEHHMLLENRTRSRQFAKEVYNLSGRSPTALLSPPYSPIRSFTQENERTSVQLAQAELDRVFSDVLLDWQLIDALGWILPANSMSYSNSSPMGAIKMLADAAGGFVYSEPSSNTLTIKPLYKKTYWDSIDSSDYDRLIPESITTDISTDYSPIPNYNGVYLTNDRTGLTGRVIRAGSAGDVLQETVNSPLLTDNTSMHSRGRAILAKAGMVETHSLQMPISEEIGRCDPAELIAFNGEWWGVVDRVSVSFNFAKVVQTVAIERVNHE